MTPGELLAHAAGLGVRLWVENGRLRFQAPAGVMNPELQSRLAASRAELISLLGQLQGPTTAGAPMERVAREGPLALSFAQQRLWFQEQLHPEAPANNLTGAVVLSGPLDIPALGEALAALVARHESLRTTLGETGGVPHQRVGAPWRPLLAPEALAGPSDGDRLEQARQVARDESARRFDLGREPPLRVRLLRLDAQRFVLVLSLHHIAADGVGLQVLEHDLAVLYRASRSGSGSSLPPLPTQVADFAAWQRRWVEGPEYTAQLVYWKRQLAGLSPVELPTDHPRQRVSSMRGAEVRLPLLSGPQARRLRALGHAEGATSYMVLLAALGVVLRRWTRQEDLVVGGAAANRHRPGLEGILGFFINLLLLRLDVGGNPRFRELVRRVRQVCVEAYSHQDLPFDRLVDALQPDRERGDSPFYRVALAVSDTPWMPGHGLKLEGLESQPLDFPRGVLDLELHLWVYDTEDGMTGRLEYAVDLYSEATARRLLEGFRLVLEAVVEAPDRPIHGLSVLGERERELQLSAWNHTGRTYPRDSTVHALFAERARRCAQAPAVRYGDRELTYGELEARAHRLARGLAARGVRRGDFVALRLERSPELIVSMLAVLEAGAAYVPLDPSYPVPRQELMLRDSGARLVLHLGPLPFSPACSTLDLGVWDASSDAPDVPVLPEGSADDLAYVIYTSGSTGQPKGVAVTHRAISRLVLGTDYVQLTPEDRMAQASNASFDAATFEIWGALLNGALLVGLSQEQTVSPSRLAEALRAQRVSVLFVTTALFNHVAREQPEAFACLGSLLFGGEAVDPVSVRRVLEQGAPRRLLHVYGPTENTTFSTFHLVASAPLPGQTVPIGMPIAHSRAYVLDEGLQPVPVGAIGELYLGGEGLALGYLGRPEATAERFVPDPHSSVPGGRLYRTGDLARRREDGAVLFVGRVDRQVKLRGFRVEPAEIEAHLREHAGVAAVAVEPRGEGSARRLLAYLVPHPGHHPGTDELRAFLRARLPEYMIPAGFCLLDALPLTPNGKLDRAALPEPLPAGPSPEQAPLVPPRGPIESLLVEIWRDVLGVPRVSAHDDFFFLGGHSLQATRIVSRLREALRVEVPLRSFFDAPRLSELAAQVQHLLGSGQQRPELLAAPRPSRLPLSFAQQRLWFLQQLAPHGTAYHILDAWRFHGAPEDGALERALARLVRRHESLRTTFEVHEGSPQQRLHATVEVPLRRVELRSHGARAWDEAVRWMRAEALRPLPLTEGPLLRVSLLRLADAEHLLFLELHHIIADGWSLGVWCRELSALYEAELNGAPDPLPPLPVQYADFALWQRDWLRGAVLEAELGHWRERLAGLSPLRLPADYVRPEVQGFNGAAHRFTLPAPLVRALRGLGHEQGASLFMVLLSAFKALLSRYSGQRDIAVGVPIANRTRGEVEGLIGFFVNTLVLRTRFEDDPSFRELLARVRESTLEAYAHQDVPFERIVEELQPERQANQNPLVQVIFALQNAPREPLRLGGLEGEHLEYLVATTRFDLELHLWEEGEVLSGIAVYDRELFGARTVEHLVEAWRTLLEGVARNTGTRVSALPLVARQEPREAPPALPVELEESIGSRFSSVARRRADAIALTQEGRHLSYAELEERSERLARRLVDGGVRPGDRVGLVSERSMARIIGLLAILKAGAAYVPLELRQPVARLGQLIDAAGVRCVLAAGPALAELEALGRPLTLVDVEAVPPDAPALASGQAPGGDALAYVLFTSGSTGAPKGVCVPHRAVLRLVHAPSYVHLSEQEVVLHYAPLEFDASTFEIWGALLNGARLVLMPPGQQSLERLGREIRSEQVSTLWLTAGLFRLMVDEQLESLRGVRQLLAGGDVLPVPQVNRLCAMLPGCRLINGYGPTECCTFVCCHTVEELMAPGGSVPIGTPIDVGQARVLDERLEPVPEGAPGELCIAGPGLAWGYLGDPALTAERFVPDPLARVAGARVYRTGDRVRLRPEGTLEFLGRLDQQLKVRGFRIEPGEVEAAVLTHPGVQSAVVVGREGPGGLKELVCYATPRVEAPATGEGSEQEGRLVREWESVFEHHLYREAAVGGSPTFNIVGWKSSYTGEPVPAEQMRDWLRHRVERVRHLAPRSILEVGCGTGLMLFALLPHCERYVGTDFSQSALDYVGQHLPAEARPRVELLCRAADDWSGLAPRAFDAVVINSVVQYFPSEAHLRTVLEHCIDAAAEGGSVFVGDVRSLPLLEAFHASVELERVGPTASLGEWRERVRRAVLEDNELVIDPAFFVALAHAHPRVRHVDIELTRGTHPNEMSRFRYNAVLHIGSEAAPSEAAPVEWLAWNAPGVDLEALRERLRREPRPLGVASIPNARVLPASRAAEALRPAGGVRRMEDLRRLVAQGEPEAQEPDLFWELAESLGYVAGVSWSPAREDGAFDVLFLPASLGTRPRWLGPTPLGRLPPEAWAGQRLASEPRRARLSLGLGNTLRAHLQARLPDFLVPSRFVVLHALPLTPNGKVDRAALPHPEPVRMDPAALVSPSNDMEQLIADVWRETLGLEAVDRQDNFFDVGGHSLLLVQVCSRLEARLGRRIELVTLFRFSSIASLAEHLTASTAPRAELAQVQRNAAERASRQQQAAQQRRARPNRGAPHDA
ncbi:non-ribosomal peptide synthetase [Cystobacter ferrugineus]|uniref:non-ribosomal peptide synthetase n=1 Tax=Cystobacter ferrugineus TaxID=83449 RepID=UPI000ABB9BA7|nr:non-ribosomal peptide synthetase [Cystobacter ferrugineus]